MDKKEIWPYPSKNDNLPGKDSQWKNRLQQVEDAGYVLWRDPKRNQKWEIRDTKSKCHSTAASNFISLLNKILQQWAQLDMSE